MRASQTCILTELKTQQVSLPRMNPILPGRLLFVLADWDSVGCILGRHEVHDWRSSQVGALRLITIPPMTLHLNALLS